MTEERALLQARAYALIEALHDGQRDDPTRDQLIHDIAQYQRQHVPPYRRLSDARAQSPGQAAMPTDVFRYCRVAAHPASEDIRVFTSSGTTESHRSHHHFKDLGLYAHAARTAARFALFPDRKRMPLLVLAPHESETRQSSLSYMLSRFEEWFGLGSATWAWQENELQPGALIRAAKCAKTSREPLAILGTAFAFMHAEDALGKTRFRLPSGSRIMYTGGFKGRSRAVEPEEFRALLSQRYGVRDPWIVGEYGMTELSSQLYETPLREVAHGSKPTARRYWIPGWVRARSVDAESLVTLAPGDEGLLRLDDAANLDSCVAIQTSDLGQVDDSGLLVNGRNPNAVPRGCSLSADMALGGDT